MKFRAGLSRAGVKILVGLAQSVEKLCEEFAIFLSEESMEFRVKPGVDCEVQVFAKVFVDSLFTDYRIESKAKNRISLVVSAKNLISGLRSADQADEAVFKLTKSNGLPCFSISATTLAGFNIKQDIPISQILSENGMKEYREPRLPTPEITMDFPDPKNVRAVLDRMKSLDKFVQVEASSRGSLAFKVQTEVVSMRTFYQGLDVRVDKIREDDDSDGGMSVVSSKSGRNVRKLRALLNIKELLNVLQFGSYGETEKLKTSTVYVPFVAEFVSQLTLLLARKGSVLLPKAYACDTLSTSRIRIWRFGRQLSLDTVTSASEFNPKCSKYVARNTYERRGHRHIDSFVSEGSLAMVRGALLVQEDAWGMSAQSRFCQRMQLIRYSRFVKGSPKDSHECKPA